jgi:hypothetical protein
VDDQRQPGPPGGLSRGGGQRLELLERPLLDRDEPELDRAGAAGREIAHMGRRVGRLGEVEELPLGRQV